VTLFRLSSWPVRARFAALLIAASLAPLVISAFIDIRGLREDRMEAARQLLTARGDQIARELDRIHQDYRTSANRVANLPVVRDYCGAPAAARQADGLRLRGVFATFPKTDNAIRGVFLVDGTGRVAVASEERLTGADLSGRPVVRDALQGKTVISSMAFAPWQGELQPTVAYLAPVHDAQGKVACAVAVGVRADIFWDVLKAANGKAGAGSYAVMMDEWGIRIGHSYRYERMVYHPSGPLPGAVFEGQVAQARFGPGTRGILEDVLPFPEQFERAVAALPDAGVFRGWAPVNQTWNFGVARRLASAHWTVFYMVPEASILAAVGEATRDKALLALGIIVAAGAIGIALAASILRPVRALETATAGLAAGDGGARVQTSGSDEFARLGESFNAMADKIQAQAADLRRSNDELRKQAHDLEIANKDLEAFAFSVSHDLRAPLQVVDGFSKMLQTRHAGQLDEKSTHYLSRIRAGVARMDQLVEGILRLSRLGRQQLHREDMDVRALVDEVLAELRASCPQAERVGVAGLGHAQADRVLLRQVFANLLSNACKFTGNQAQPAISVGRESLDGEDVFFVRDNGAGFDPAQAESLFEPFHRLHAAEEFPGLGIGLSIVKRIVQRHGGRIWAQGKPGEGACFYFTVNPA
jgi:signal transduction histidine kinase